MTPTTAAAQLDLKWRALREQLEQQGAGESVTTEIEHAVMDLRAPIGRSGRAVVAGAEGVLPTSTCSGPPPRRSSASLSLPYIVPSSNTASSIRTISWWWSTTPGADITTRIDGTLRSETVDGGGYPVHKASGAETAGYGDRQLRTDEAARKNLRAVADRVSELVDDAAVRRGLRGRRGSIPLGSARQRCRNGSRERAVPLPVGARHGGHDFRNRFSGPSKPVRRATAERDRQCRRTLHRRGRPAVRAGRRGARTPFARPCVRVRWKR